MELDLWNVICRTRFVEPDLWNLVCGTWSLELCLWNMICWTWLVGEEMRGGLTWWRHSLQTLFGSWKYIKVRWFCAHVRVKGGGLTWWLHSLQTLSGSIYGTIFGTFMDNLWNIYGIIFIYGTFMEHLWNLDLWNAFFARGVSLFWIYGTLDLWNIYGTFMELIFW